MLLACFDAGFSFYLLRLSRNQSRGFAVQGLQMWDGAHVKISQLEKMISYPQGGKKNKKKNHPFPIRFLPLMLNDVEKTSPSDRERKD